MYLERFKGAIFILLSAVFWGTAGIFVGALREYGISEFQIIFGRALFTVLMLGLFMLVYNRRLFIIKLKDLWLFAITGIGSITFFNFCYYKTMALTNLSVAAVLMYTAPIFVMIISLVFFKEKLNAVKVICCVAAVVGVALVSGVVGSSSGINAEGLIFGLLTGFGYSLYGIFGSVLIKKGYSPYTINFYAFIFVFVAVTCILGFGGQLPATVSNYTVSYKPILIVAGMALINTVIPYICYASGLKTVPASIAIIIATIEPLVAMVIDIFLGNTPDLFGYLGIAIILASVLVLNLKGTSDPARKHTDSRLKRHRKMMHE